jgi:hypothetical protein
LHPTLRIALYVLSALALPGLSFLGLAITAVLALALFHRNLAGARRLLRRARWLFLLLGIGYAYSLPGPTGIPMLGELSPSVPGLWLGATQMLRLFLLLWLLDGLVISMGETNLMAGLYGLFSLIGWLGFPVERTTVRLGLTLQVMEGNLGRRRGLREALAGLNETAQGNTHFEIRPSAWRTSDSILLIVSLALLVGVWRA